MESSPTEHTTRVLAPEERRTLFAQEYPGLEYLAAIAGLEVVSIQPALEEWQRKSELLDIPPERVWKTLYFETPRGYLYGVSLPMHNRVDWTKLYDALELPRRTRQDFQLARTLPVLQAPGSCTPFLKANGREDVPRVKRIVLQETREERALDWGFPGRKDLSILLSQAQTIATLISIFPYCVVTGDIAQSGDRPIRGTTHIP